MSEISEYVPVTERRLLELRSTTKKDRDMQWLQKVILKGWPVDKTHLEPKETILQLDDARLVNF